MINLIDKILEEIIAKFKVGGNNKDIAYEILSSAVSFDRAIDYIVFNNENFSFNKKGNLVNNPKDAGIDAFDIKACADEIVVKFNQSKNKDSVSLNEVKTYLNNVRNYFISNVDVTEEDKVVKIYQDKLNNLKNKYEDADIKYEIYISANNNNESNVRMIKNNFDSIFDDGKSTIHFTYNNDIKEYIEAVKKKNLSENYNEVKHTLKFDYEYNKISLENQDTLVGIINAEEI